MISSAITLKTCYFKTGHNLNSPTNLMTGQLGPREEAGDNRYNLKKKKKTIKCFSAYSIETLAVKMLSLQNIIEIK